MRLHRELRGDDKIFGNQGLIQEQSRDAWGTRWLDSLSQDLRYGVRTLLKVPGFTIVAVLTLALAIGANTAVFSVMNGVLLQPLPFPHQDRILFLYERSRTGDLRGPSYPTFLDWQSQGSAFSSMAFVSGRGTRITMPDGVEPALISFVSPDFFEVLGEQPYRGRLFSPEELEQGGHVAILTYDEWQLRFGGDPGILGKPIRLSDGTFTVIGVLPHDVVYPDWSQSQIYVPLMTIAASAHVLTERGHHADSRVIGRLRPGVTPAQAATSLGAIEQRLALAYPDLNKDWISVDQTSLRDEILGDAEPQVLILMAAVALILLIALANVTSLSLARAGARARELAVRRALGAGRGRVIRQLLTESLLLATMGGAIGVVGARAAIGLLRPTLDGIFPRIESVTVDVRVLGFTTLVTIIATVLVGLTPALRATRPDLVGSLKDGTGGSGAGRERQRLRSVLVAGQVGLSVVLVVVAGLLIRSLWQLRRVDLGFTPTGLITFHISPPPGQYDDPTRKGLLYSRVIDAVRVLPGVTHVGVTNFLPLADYVPSRVEMAGHTPDPTDDRVAFLTVSPDYVATMGVPLRSGRALTDGDLAGGTAVIVNEAFVRHFFPGTSPLGRELTLHNAAGGRSDFGAPIPATIVGVVGDVHQFSLQTPPEPQVFVPYTRDVWPHIFLAVRAGIPAAALIPSLRQAVRSVDPGIVTTEGDGSSVVRAYAPQHGLDSQQLDTWTLGIFAGVALLLATMGIYGLLMYSVAQRRREMGIRLALGASRTQVLRLVIDEGMRLVVVGLVVGAAGALALTRLIASLLYGVQPTDPLTFVTVAGAVVIAALVACVVPARRAAAVDPITSLRAE
ncbi:MAG TPA: ABC transporter permease [Gemmatimonadales bacterium]|nr:ABC transporter permease [Gemmatimonadales bacterium]